MKPSTRRFLRRWISFGAVMLALAVLGANRWVINSTDAYVFKDWALLPFNEVGVVLGTSKYMQSGKPSPEFRWRVTAAAELYRNGKVKHLIVSGANPDETYNEPRHMYRELVAQGVPESAITMDFAGFRTFDSVIRAKAVFGLDRFTIVTQKYHSYRAVFIGRKMDLNVVAYLAPATSDGGPGNRHPVREVFARMKAVLDIFLLRTEPRFLGDPHPIQLAPEAEPA
ncbi:SanA/YdcF family protein [Sinimarinibacterium flocculans]|uniref:Vancomycin permeability regulator SanA n=1 Tax=Sinimarinibacterium flocculans TaxID=985250 RepID=A0A318ECU8_9GAMM|nr:ElyC/SanA/YdcF family protein [Sinimarinibacterium flocculans]MEC9363877.1 ElyC/SanA/YdcF family protein [Pseudomonadota bacterium]PXV67741.1 vancomycin permeability regulator SanA [Sinimarinibacterium flocculans]